jgi:hypothetical protein
VEGGSDKRLVEGVLVNEEVVVFVAGTRSKVLDVAERSIILKIDRIACLVDRDFDDAVEIAEAAGWPVISYDGGDLEDMLARSPALARVIDELASEEKLRSYGGSSAVLNKAQLEMSALAKLRRANAMNHWSIPFDKVDILSKIDKGTLELNVRSMCAALAQSADGSVSIGELEEVLGIGEHAECPRTGHKRFRGRDLIMIVSVAFRKLIGTLPRDQVAPEHLAGVLRLSSDLQWFRSTDWYGDLTRLTGFERRRQASC